MPAEQIFIAVMTYNRGIELANCVASLQSGAKFSHRIEIFDDGSDDLSSRVVLDLLAQQFPVHIARAVGGSKKVKGLYSNMDHALARAKELGSTHILYIQDDMQWIRSVEQAEMDRLCSCFTESLCQIGLSFMKLQNGRQKTKLVILDERRRLILPKVRDSGYLTGLTDLGLSPVDMLDSADWKFGPTEPEQIARARALGWYRALLLDPVTNFLPWPVVHRKDSAPLRWARKSVERWAKAGTYRFSKMSEAAVASMKNRPHPKPLFAEDVLTLERGARAPMPWNYYDALKPAQRRIRSWVRRTRAC